ncbi:RHS repeat domain-containing protein [Agaribacter flavus]|uniref:RHS repeat domain-containing protein n=1 Tax=Agaribacter flavus TaxID=1902781 RepID=A0ABV7FUJ9_9ALTE
MNGRIYDPTLGRFLQADPFIQALSNSQNYNRYSYVLNNPMSYTDPSGYFFKKLWQKTTGALLRAIANIPILNLAAHAAACYFGDPLGCAAYASASTYANGIESRD